MMAQWHACKEKAKDALLLFRLGDFYEAFYQDAELISKEINLTLTARQGVPMCGVPYLHVESYIDKLIAKGHKVAIAEQVEGPQQTKGLIKREITQILTPGTIVTSQLINDKKNNFFASVSLVKDSYGLSYADLTTGEFYALVLDDLNLLLDELHRLRAKEFLVQKEFLQKHPLFFEEFSHVYPFLLNEKEGIDLKVATDALINHFDHGFGLKPEAILASGMLLLYLKEELNLSLEQITSVQTEHLTQFMAIDRTTLRNLEITESLLDFLDNTNTPMGARLLASWLKRPLLTLGEIQKRQNAIDGFLEETEKSDDARFELAFVRDIERLNMKIVSKMATPRDLYSMGVSLKHLPHLKEILTSMGCPEIQQVAIGIFDAGKISETILSAMHPSPPLRIGEGDIFKDGYHPELDRLRALSKDSITWMANYQNRLREETGIKSLKVGFTRAFGYYIEVSRAQSESVPITFHRRQTLVGNERYITEELKQYEHQVLSSEAQSKALEAEEFEKLRITIANETLKISNAARLIAKIDVLLSLATTARKRNFVRPVIDESNLIEIVEGRHPILEAVIGSNSFIPNDTTMSEKQQMMLITGPNMAGKSTYIRQVALIVILAQIGSYVPAKSAHIGIVDKVFSRIGASDDLARGQSTFMVEMTETAHILNNATSKSIVLLDEIGRGTSTYDGISIAWAVSEYLLTTKNRTAKTLFATHYWELTQLEDKFPHAMNYHTSIQETDSGIVFLKKIVRGGTDKSYGIHVAKLAGLPPKVIAKAEKMLQALEAKVPRKSLDLQLSLFET